jgi:hypothetical protein
MGSLRKWTRWEFWPPWAAYAPLVPYWLWLGVKHRSFTAFTAANPGIPSGGLAGESKTEILRRLPRAAEFATVRAAAAAEAFAGRHGYPIVLKPDAGERGTGVAIVRNAAQLRAYMERARGLVIAQRYVDGLEFGVFYLRYPGRARGRITSIAAKRFPHLTGDGVRTVAQLIAADPRASLIADAYRESCPRPMHEIPASGERVPLVEVGSHCRGAVFLDAGHLWTPALEAAIDAEAQSHPGFFLGRFDLRAPSERDFQAGRFLVLELNGVAAEPAHIYDPRVTVWEAYRTMFRQWRAAFEIGALNREQGSEPLSFGALWKLWRQRRADQRDLGAMHHQHGGRAQKHHHRQREQFSVIADRG